MYYEEESSAMSFVSGVMIGMAVGAGLALLLAPQSGKRMRRQLVRSVEGFREAGSDRLLDATDELRSAVRSKRSKWSF